MREDAGGEAYGTQDRGEGRHPQAGGAAQGARAATIGKDLLCRDGCTASGGVRLRRTEARKSVQFVGATLVGVVVSLTSGNERAGFAAAGALAFSGLIAQWLLRDRIGRAHDLNTFAAPSVEQA